MVWKIYIILVALRYSNFVTLPDTYEAKGVIVNSQGLWVPTNISTTAYYLIEIGGINNTNNNNILSALIFEFTDEAHNVAVDITFNPHNQHFCIF